MKTLTTLYGIIITLLLLTCSNAYSQTDKPTIELTLTESSDTAFIINKPFAAMMAARFDSLKYSILRLQQCDNLVSIMHTQNYTNTQIIDTQKDLIDNLVREIYAKNQIIISHNRDAIVTNELLLKATRQSRQAKVWRGIAIGALIAGTASTIYLLAR